MEDTYAVYFRDKLCGKVQVLRQGLYYLFMCRCQLSEEGIYRLKVTDGNGEQYLGILTPMDDGFGLRTKVPAKRFFGEMIRFDIALKHDIATGFFVPVYPEEPFAYLEKLKNAYLEKRDGQIGVYIK